jgi:hypothetical protein
MSDAANNPRHNQLLASLSKERWECWRLQLQYVDMPLGHVLHEPGDTQNHLYFPTTAIVSLLYVMKNGESAEIAIVGNEGLVGVSLFMGARVDLQPCSGAKCERRLSPGSWIDGDLRSVPANATQWSNKSMTGCIGWDSAACNNASPIGNRCDE